MKTQRPPSPPRSGSHFFFLHLDDLSSLVLGCVCLGKVGQSSLGFWGFVCHANDPRGSEVTLEGLHMWTKGCDQEKVRQV